MDQLKIEDISVTLEGLSDIMFDPFHGQEKDTKPPEQKFYMAEGNVISLPSENVFAFLFSETNPPGCAKSFEGKGSKEYIRMGQAHVVIEPFLIPFCRDGGDIKFGGFDDKSCYVSEFAPRTKLGSLSIKQNVKLRPVLMLPWTLKCTIRLVENPKVDKVRLFNWFARGGILIGLGTYRPRFGRFTVRFD